MRGLIIAGYWRAAWGMWTLSLVYMRGSVCICQCRARLLCRRDFQLTSHDIFAVMAPPLSGSYANCRPSRSREIGREVIWRESDKFLLPPALGPIDKSILFQLHSGMCVSHLLSGIRPAFSLLNPFDAGILYFFLPPDHSHTPTLIADTKIAGKGLQICVSTSAQVNLGISGGKTRVSNGSIDECSILRYRRVVSK